ncbi:MAG: hypothetical protein NC926_11345 [Candidatus Omnitrophica bacterium]|nr:hypothetical protein [Candidatus Omnitrophota bacterium]
MLEIKNEKLLKKFLDLAEFMKRHKISVNSKTYKKALSTFVEFHNSNLDFDTALDYIIKKNLLDLKEFIIFKYLYEIDEIDREKEIISFTQILRELIEILP